MSDELFDTTASKILFGLLAFIIVACLGVLAASGIQNWWDPKPAPHGCAWIDLDPGKTSDIRLACVKGYPK